MDDLGLDRDELDHLLTWVQSGVVSRQQLVDLGATPHHIRRMLRRGELVRVHPGVYVNHNGPLTWEQRAWCAVLVHWPAALARESALPRPAEDGPIHVAVDRKRTVKPVPGVVAHRTPDLAGRGLWQRSPPRVALEHAAIDVAATWPPCSSAEAGREPSTRARTALCRDPVPSGDTRARHNTYFR